MTGPAPHGPPAPPRARKDVEKYLLPSEGSVVATRRHWAVLIGPTVKFLPVFVVGGWLLLLDPGQPGQQHARPARAPRRAVYYGLRVAEWWMRHFIVTKRRVLLTSGVIVRTVTLLPLRRITDLTWQETLAAARCSATAPSASSPPARTRRCGTSPTCRTRSGCTARSAGCCSAATTGGAGGDAGTTRATTPAAPAPPPGAGRRERRHDTEPIPGLPPPQA